MYKKELKFGGLTLGKLRSLVEIGNEGYIAAAAGHDKDRANLMSQQMSSLESFFGTELREKKGKLVGLSMDGEKLAEITRNFYKALQAYDDEVNDRPPKFVLASGQSVLSALVLPAMKSIRGKVSDSRIDLRNMRSSEIVKSLNMGEIDLAIVSESYLGRGFEKRVLGLVEYKLYIPKSLKAISSKKEAIKSLSELPQATITGVGKRRKTIEELARKRGYEPKFELECSTFNDVAEAVLSGSYCAILPSYLDKKLDSEETYCFEISEFKNLQGKLCLGWKNSSINLKPKKNQIIDEIYEIISKNLKRNFS